MNTNLTQDDDSIEFKKAVKSPYKCPFRLMISNDDLFLSSLREAEDDHETFLVISELDENNQIVMSSNFVKRIRHIIPQPYNLEMVKSSLERALKLQDDNLLQVHQYVIQNDGSIHVYYNFVNFSNYLHQRIIVDCKVLSNEVKLRSYFYSIIEGLQYLHNNNYVHLSISLQKIYSHQEEFHQFKICGFETLQQINTQLSPELHKFLIANLPLVPPELRCQNYIIQPSFDIFCLGVVIFQMSTCQLPENNKRTNQLILRKFVSKGLMNIIITMLDSEANNRPTLTTLLEDDWFQYVNQNQIF